MADLVGIETRPDVTLGQMRMTWVSPLQLARIVAGAIAVGKLASRTDPNAIVSIDTVQLWAMAAPDNAIMPNTANANQIQICRYRIAYLILIVFWVSTHCKKLKARTFVSLADRSLANRSLANNGANDDLGFCLWLKGEGGVAFAFIEGDDG